MNIDFTSDPADIVQDEPDAYETRPVAVEVCGPVQTREMPAIGQPGYFTAPAIGTTLGVRVLPMEPRRKYAILLPVDQDVWLATSQAGAQSGAAGAMRVPASIPYPIHHMHEVWACAVAGTTDVGVETVAWSE